MSEPSPLQSAIADYQAAALAVFTAYAVAVAEYETVTGDRLPRVPFSLPTVPGISPEFGAFNLMPDSPNAVVSVPELCAAVNIEKLNRYGAA